MPVTEEKKARVAEAIRLEEEEGLSYLQIADRMGVAPPTASMYLREGKRRRNRFGPPRKSSKPPDRLSIRIDPDLYKRLERRMRELNRGVKRFGDRITQRQVIEKALNEHLAGSPERDVYLQRKDEHNGGDPAAGEGKR